MILKIVNIETDQVLLEGEFELSQIPKLLPNWETQTELYSIQNPPIYAKLIKIDTETIPVEE